MLANNHPDALYALTHRQPDLDAVTAAWLAERYLFPLHYRDGIVPAWRFIPFTGVAPGIIERAAIVVDVGGRLEPPRFFDHHQLAHPRSTCAARLVFEYLRCGDGTTTPLRPDLGYLEGLIDLVQAGDTGQLPAQGWQLSTRLGLHALLLAARQEKVETFLSITSVQNGDYAEDHLLDIIDRHTLQTGFHLLDLLAGRERRWDAIQRSFPSTVVYRSRDDRVWALHDAPYGSISCAVTQGAALVVSQHMQQLPTTYCLEIWAGEGANVPDVRVLLRNARTWAVQHGQEALVQTIDELYQEERFAVRGTPKAPRREAAAATALALAQVLDCTWSRPAREPILDQRTT